MGGGWTIADVIAELPPSPHCQRLAAPDYTGTSPSGLGLAVESMKRHTTDEGWQIFAGLEHAGYQLAGRRLTFDETDVAKLLAPGYQPLCSCCQRPLDIHFRPPGVVVVQDHREWDVPPGDFRDKTARFFNVGHLRERTDLFRLTILKDSHQRPDYHRAAANEIGCHGWIIYYHPRIVTHLAPYVRPEHLVRTYHSLDRDIVPQFRADRPGGALLSGAMSNVYPLRRGIFKRLRYLPRVEHRPHPGYHGNGCETPEFLSLLSRFKVAICTASLYGYALRKIIEATACGCVVLTDLPDDEVLPEIDGNLVRLHHHARLHTLPDILNELYAKYDPARQEYLAERAKRFYDYRASGARLANDIESLRIGYEAN